MGMAIVGEEARGKGIDRMRDDCVALLAMILRRRMVSIEELALESGLSERTVYRWINSFSFIMPITVNGGVAYVGDNFDMQRLHQLKIFSKTQEKIFAP